MSARLSTRQRIILLAGACPHFFSRRDLAALVQEQLGHVEALDRPIRRGGVWVRARAPRVIHHVCAGNLAISAVTSLVHGLLLGARNTVQLPSAREESSARREIAAFVRALPAPLRAQVELCAGRDDAALTAADTVIAFGNDATIAALRTKLLPTQRFIAHGHAVSLLWLAKPDHLTLREARGCAIDVLTYDQLGCLSPQAIYFPSGADAIALGSRLARALQTEWGRATIRPPRPLGVRARIAEARDVALALGHAVWRPRHLGWTVIHDPDATFTPSPLHGVVYLRSCAIARLETALAPVRGRISTVGLAAESDADPRARRAFAALGATRFCRAGRMQFPPVGWHHDGRTALAELVTWIDDETGT